MRAFIEGYYDLDAKQLRTRLMLNAFINIDRSEAVDLICSCFRETYKEDLPMDYFASYEELKNYIHKKNDQLSNAID